MKRETYIKTLLALGAFNVLMAAMMFDVDENLGLLFCMNGALFSIAAIAKASV